MHSKTVFTFVIRNMPWAGFDARSLPSRRDQRKEDEEMHKLSVPVSLWLIVVGSLTIGCEDLGDSFYEYFDCDPNETRKCYCRDGSQGIQICAPDGGTWQACLCQKTCEPGSEVCDGYDNDCDGLTDEADASDATTWYHDADSDGFTNNSDTQKACEDPDGSSDHEWVEVPTEHDCDDEISACGTSCYPGNPDVCDGYDNDCDEETADGSVECEFGCDGVSDCYQDCNPTGDCCDPDGTTCDHGCDAEGSCFPQCDGVSDDCCDPDGTFCDHGCDAAGNCFQDCDGNSDDCCDPDGTFCDHGCNGTECYEDCNPDSDECCYSDGTSCDPAFCCNGSCDSWYDEDWDFRIKLTVNAAKVKATLNDFPVYVNLAHLGTHFFNAVQAGGADVRVTEADGKTELPLEIDLPDKALKKGELHFKAASLSGVTDTVFYIYYGNEAADAYPPSDIHGSRNVWDDHYKGVWHLNEDPAVESAVDSTSGSHTGTPTSVEGVSEGKIGGADRFGEVSSYISIPYDSDFDFYDPFTISVWARPTDSTRNDTFNKGDDTLPNGFSLSVVADTPVFISNDGYALQSPYSVPRDDWSYLVVSWDGTKLALFVDGTESDSAAVENLNLNAADQLFLSRNDIMWGFDGELDEARVSSGIARSSAWILTEYNNQSQPSEFYRAHVDLCTEDAPGIDCETDEDGDGFLADVCAGGIDCDDSPETGSDCQTDCTVFYQDADSDDYGNASNSVPACSAPEGFVVDGTDCDDGNSECHDGCQEFYHDGDGDGYGDPSTYETACSAPSGYVSDNTDCDDDDGAHWSSGPGDGCDDDCVDADADGYGTNCDLGDDCEDEDATEYPGLMWYPDADGDGYGDGSATGSECARASSTDVLDNTDCDDAVSECGAGCYPGNKSQDICDGYDNDCDGESDEQPELIWYHDADSDGYTNNSDTQAACDDPDGSSIDEWVDRPTTNDCDDNVASCNTDCTTDLDLDNIRDCEDECVDYDGDGRGTNCAAGTDCNDNDENCHEGCTVFYPDSDGDGFGDSDVSKRLIACGTAIPDGYSVNYQDCDDGDELHWSFGPGDDCDDDCTDVDEDGYGPNCDLGEDCCDSDNRCHEGCS